MKKEINVALKEYVDSQIQSHILNPTYGSAVNLNAMYVTGTVTFPGSATTGKGDEQQIKEWAVMIGKKFGMNVMFDVVFAANGTHRISGMMYKGSYYGYVQWGGVKEVKNMFMYDGVWG